MNEKQIEALKELAELINTATWCQKLMLQKDKQSLKTWHSFLIHDSNKAEGLIDEVIEIIDNEDLEKIQ